MADDFDISLELAQPLANRAAAWRFIERFAAAWLRPIHEGDGFDDADLDAAEARLGLRLPVALREAFARFGRRRDMTRMQDELLSPWNISVHEEHLLFRVEAQSVMLWGVRLSDLDVADPPVQMRYERWQPWLPSVSLACVEMVLSECVMGGDGFPDNRETTDADDGALGTGFVRLAIPAYPNFGMPPAQQWFARSDVLVHAFGSWLWVLARTEQSLDDVRRDMPGDWQMLPLPE